MATSSVVETRMPSARVPSKSEAKNIRKPKKSTMLVYIMDTPVSRTASRTASRMFQPWRSSSCRYLANRWMVSSTEMPKAMLKTSRVLGLSAMPKYPITAAVKMSGTRLGKRLMATILALRKRMDITVAITSTARASDTKRFLTR